MAFLLKASKLIPRKKLVRRRSTSLFSQFLSSSPVHLSLCQPLCLFANTEPGLTGAGSGQANLTQQQSNRKLSLSSGARCSLRLSEAATTTSRQVRDISRGNNSNQFEADVCVVQPAPSSSIRLSFILCIPISPPSSPPPILVRSRTESNMRRIYPPDLEGVRSVVYNRDHESRDATIGGSFGFVVGRTIGSTNTVCVVNRFSDRNIGRATQMRD